MRSLLGWVALSIVAFPLAARGEGSFQVNARAGVARPFGDVGNGQQVGDFAGWAFPLEAQLQFRFWKQLSLGAYGRYAPTLAASSCSDCTTTDVGLGAMAEYRFSEELEGGPWISVSAGWERLDTDVPTALGDVSTELTGFEGAVGTGADFELGGLTVGPYLQLSLGQFTRTSSGGVSESIASKGVHAYLAVGVRLALLL